MYRKTSSEQNVRAYTACGNKLLITDRQFNLLLDREGCCDECRACLQYGLADRYLVYLMNTGATEVYESSATA